MSDKKCLYCKEPCNSEEHVLQKGFGSTLCSKEILCSKHNNFFSKLDKLCIKKYDFIYNQCGFLGGSRNKAKSLVARNKAKSLVAKDNKDRDITILGDQSLNIRKNVKCSKDKDGSTIIDVQGTIPDVKKFIEKKREEYKSKEKEIEVEERGTVLRESVLLKKISFEPIYFKGIKRSLLNFICYCDYELAHSHIFANSINDILRSTSDFNKANSEPIFPLYAINREILEHFFDLECDSGLAHTLIVSCNNSDRSVIGVVILFSNFIHAFLLSEEFSGESKTFYYSHDPMHDPMLVASNSTALKKLDTAPLSRKELVQKSGEEIEELFKKSLENLYPKMQERARETYINTQMNHLKENPFGTLSIPSGYVKDQKEEIKKAVRMWFKKLINFRAQNGILNDESALAELNEIADQFASGFINQFGEKKCDEVVEELASAITRVAFFE